MVDSMNSSRPATPSAGAAGAAARTGACALQQNASARKRKVLFAERMQGIRIDNSADERVEVSHSLAASPGAVNAAIRIYHYEPSTDGVRLFIPATSENIGATPVHLLLGLAAAEK